MSINTLYQRKIAEGEKYIYDQLHIACQSEYVDECIADALYHNKYNTVLFNHRFNRHHNYNKLFYEEYHGKRPLYHQLNEKYGNEYVIYFEKYTDYTGPPLCPYQVLYLRRKYPDVKHKCIII